MARKAAPGIPYYPREVDMVRHKKIKLLFNEFDSHGPWVLDCILSEIYRDKGYYMDTRDEDGLLLFAGDICKKPLELVRNVIASAVKRGLFSSTVYAEHGALTSDRIQENYLRATSERRRKGTTIELRAELVCMDLDSYEGVEIVEKNTIVPGSNEIDPRNNSQSKVKVKKSKVKVKKSKVKLERENSFSRPLTLEKMLTHLRKHAQKYYPAELNKAKIEMLKMQDLHNWTPETVKLPEVAQAVEKFDAANFEKFVGCKMLSEAEKCLDHYAARNFKIDGQPILSWPSVMAGWMNKRDRFKNQ